MTGDLLEKLDMKLDEYNEKNPDHELSYQELCERALKQWIRYGNIENL